MARRSWDASWTRYAESKPIPVDDGIATSKQRGAMADQWWSQRFVTVLEGYGLGARMQRGRRYARAGQVVTFDVRPGQLLAQVQGSRRTPYLVTVDASPATEAQWASVDAALGARVVFAARLLAGDVPIELESVFDDARVALFPRRWADLRAHCSCPDSANPCKHIAAVLYVFADQLDADPWLLLAWRGRTRDQVLAALGAVGSRPVAADVSVTTTASEPTAPVSPRASARRGTTGRASRARPSADSQQTAGSFDVPAGDEHSQDGDDSASMVATWWPLTPGAGAGMGADRDEVDRTGDLADPLDQFNPSPSSNPAAVLSRLDPLGVSVHDTPVVALLGAAYEVMVRPSPT